MTKRDIAGINKMEFDIVKWRSNEWMWRLVDEEGIVISESRIKYSSEEAVAVAINKVMRGLCFNWKVNGTVLEDCNADCS